MERVLARIEQHSNLIEVAVGISLALVSMAVALALILGFLALGA